MMKHFSENKMQNIRKGPVYWAALFFVSLLIVCFVTVDIQLSRFVVFAKGTQSSVALYTLAVMGVCWFLNYVAERLLSSRDGIAQTIVQCVLSIFFTIASLLSVYYETKTAIKYSIMTTIESEICLMAAVCGGFLFFFIIFRLIWQLSGIASQMKNSDKGWLERFLGKNLYRNCIILLVVCWLPQYIIRFPGVVAYDNWQSLAMYLGYTEVTTQHPLIWNVLIGKLTDLGVYIGINWLAPLVICLVHHILAVFVVSYTVSTIKKMGLGNIFTFGVLVFFAILPPMYIYASTIYNDFIYCLAFLLLTVELVHYLYDRKTYFSGVRHGLLTALASFATVFRYNGIYTMLAVVAVIAIREFFLLIKSKAKFKQTVAVLLLLTFPLLGGQVLQRTLNETYEAKKITSRAMLAMPIQQTVRCLKIHGDKIPQKEYDAIHAVLTWSDEKYSQEYNPRNFDNVKESFKTDATKEEIAEFIKAWLTLVKLYPKDCIAASVNQTYYLFSPLVQNVRYYKSIADHADLAYIRYGFDASPYIYHNSLLNRLCSMLAFCLTKIFPAIPVVGLTVNQGVYTILLFAICLCLLFKKDKRALVLTVTMLVTLGITFIGPAVFDHPRYTYPIMYCMPLLIAAYMISNPKKNPSMEE